jgi:gas vesicle protein
MSESRHTGDFVAGLVVGALVGAAAALLFAPQSGEQTRAKIREKGIELQERADELSVEAHRRAADLQAAAKDKAEGLSTQAREKAAGLQTKVEQVVDEGRSAAGQQKEDLLTELEAQPIAEEPPIAE